MNTRHYQFKSKSYSTRHIIFALLCLLLGYFISRCIPVLDHPMAAFFSIIVSLAVALVVIKPHKKRLSGHCLWCSLVTILLAASVILSANKSVVSISFLLSLATICYMVSAEYGNRIEKGFSDYFYIDYILAVAIPFRALAAILDALFGRFSGKGARYLGKIALGIGIALIPAYFVFSNLSYDDGFRTMMNDIFSFDAVKLYDTMADLCVGILIGMYLFGLFVASEAGYHKDFVTAEGCQESFRKLKILPQITAFSAAIPILFVYVVFFVSQWQYYISGFTGILPENFSYAEYAREGFFQLCTVSAVNLVIIIAISLFIRRGNSGSAPVLKLLTGIFCLFTLVLIATAVAKLAMYIDFYGMTLKRFYAMWAMAVIALVFLVIALGQFIRRFKTVAISLCVTGILFCGLGLCNPNALTAQYNVDRYLADTTQQLDVNALKDLGVSAVPAMVELIETEDAVTDVGMRYEIITFLRETGHKYTHGDFSVIHYNIPDYLAMDALQDAGYIQ